jgi:hydrogenase expression/formation protein HypC
LVLRTRSSSMCLAIPSKITKIENNMATIDVEGVQREASLLLLEDAQVGDYVIVHAGFAIHKLDEAAARETLDLLREALAAVEKGESNPN